MKQNDIYKKKSRSFESLFYSLINMLAYSKFSETMGASKDNPNDNGVKTVKDFYLDFEKNEKDFSENFGEKLYQNLNLIIDQFCVEKIKEFVQIGVSSKDKLVISQSINKFFIENNQNIKPIGSKFKESVVKKLQKQNLSQEYVGNIINELQEKENACYIYIKTFVEELRKENPQKLQELIDFEISRRELKVSSDQVKFVLQGKENLPSNIFLLKTKECAKIKRAEKLAKKSFCTIS